MTLIEKRTRKPFRAFAPSPSYLQEGRPLTGDQIVDRAAQRTPRPVSGKRLLVIGAVAISLFGFAIGFFWGWVFPIFR